MAAYCAALKWTPQQVMATPWTDLELIACNLAAQAGRPFSRQLLPHEQEAKEEGLAFARRLLSQQGPDGRR